MEELHQLHQLMSILGCLLVIPQYCGCDVGFAPPGKGTSINDMCNACDSKFTDCVGGDFDGTQDDTVVDPNKKLLQKSRGRIVF